MQDESNNEISSSCDSSAECTELIHCVRKRRIRMVRDLASFYGTRDGKGRTALMHASKLGLRQIAGELFTKEVGLKDNAGRTALMYAAKHNQIDIAELLLESEIGNADNEGRTALSYAAEAGAIDMCKILLSREAGIPDVHGWTASHWACAKGHLRVLEMVWDADAPQRDVEGRNCLMLAAYYDAVQCVNFFVSRGLLLRQKDLYGYTALMRAVQRNNTAIIKILAVPELGCQNGLGETALMLACRQGLQEAAILLDRELHIQDKKGQTALMLAAECGCVDVAKLCIEERGAQDKTGKTALMRAALKGHLQVVTLLLDEIGIRTRDGKTALMAACLNGHLNIVNALLDEVGVQDAAGRSAMHRAAENGHTEIVRLLVGFENCLQDNGGNTALFLSAQAGHLTAAEILLQEEEEVLTHRGEAAWEAARQHPACQAFLFEAEAWRVALSVVKRELGNTQLSFQKWLMLDADAQLRLREGQFGGAACRHLVLGAAFNGAESNETPVLNYTYTDTYATTVSMQQWLRRHNAIIDPQISAMYGGQSHGTLGALVCDLMRDSAFLLCQAPLGFSPTLQGVEALVVGVIGHTVLLLYLNRDIAGEALNVQRRAPRSLARLPLILRAEKGRSLSELYPEGFRALYATRHYAGENPDAVVQIAFVENLASVHLLRKAASICTLVADAICVALDPLDIDTAEHMFPLAEKHIVSSEADQKVMLLISADFQASFAPKLPRNTLLSEAAAERLRMEEFVNATLQMRVLPEQCFTAELDFAAIQSTPEFLDAVEMLLSVVRSFDLNIASAFEAKTVESIKRALIDVVQAFQIDQI